MKPFEGPLFVVGMPRSGTKLLRELLNRNPAIGIHPLESDFIPYLVNKHGRNCHFSSDAALRLFYNEFCRTGFFIEMINRGKKLEWRFFFDSCKNRNWTGVFEPIFKFYAPPNRNERFIWGDKTPGYLNQLPLLKAVFPEAKFIHIIRDPRDYSLSVEKAWNKNVFRAAERWRHNIEKARSSGYHFIEDYHEIKYEALLSNPTTELKKICQFLECTYNPMMESLPTPAENLGAAKGANYILGSNSKKYFKDFTKAKIKRIEEITFPVLSALKYDTNYGDRFKPLNAFQKMFYKMKDSVAIVNFYSRNGTGSYNFLEILNNYRKSSWR